MRDREEKAGRPCQAGMGKAQFPKPQHYRGKVKGKQNHCRPQRHFPPSPFSPGMSRPKMQKCKNAKCVSTGWRLQVAWWQLAAGCHMLPLPAAAAARKSPPPPPVSVLPSSSCPVLPPASFSLYKKHKCPIPTTPPLLLILLQCNGRHLLPGPL